jgi:hypothetical protein
VDVFRKGPVFVQGEHSGLVPASWREEARGRIGDYFAEVLLLDQATKADKARKEIGWQPTGPGLVEELRQGGCRR